MTTLIVFYLVDWASQTSWWRQTTSRGGGGSAVAGLGVGGWCYLSVTL